MSSYWQKNGGKKEKRTQIEKNAYYYQETVNTKARIIARYEEAEIIEIRIQLQKEHGCNLLPGRRAHLDI